MTAEHLSADRSDAAAREEAERTGTVGLPLFEWAKSERVRKGGIAEMRKELEQPKPDFAYVAEVAGVFADRSPARASQTDAPADEAPPERAEGRGVDVRGEIRALIAPEWDMGMRWVRRPDSVISDVVASFLRTIDPERFDREMTEEDRNRIWGIIATNITRADWDRDRYDFSRLPVLLAAQRLDPARFAEIIQTSSVWEAARKEWNSLRMNDMEEDWFLSYAAVANELFGPGATREQMDWSALRDRVMERVTNNPELAWQLGSLQKIVPESERAVSRCPRNLWDRIRERFLQREIKVLTLFAILKDLVDLQVEE